MPQGVEHVCSAVITMFPHRVMIPLMPQGVEHVEGEQRDQNEKTLTRVDDQGFVPQGTCQRTHERRHNAATVQGKQAGVSGRRNQPKEASH